MLLLFPLCHIDFQDSIWLGIQLKQPGLSTHRHQWRRWSKSQHAWTCYHHHVWKSLEGSSDIADFRAGDQAHKCCSLLPSMRLRRVGHDWATSLSLFTFMYWRRKWEPTPAWRIPGMVEPGGLPSMGSHRVGHNWSNLAVAATLNLSLPLEVVLMTEWAWL